MSISIEKTKEMQINKPSDYDRLTLIDKILLNVWIMNEVEPYRIQSFNGPTSYRLKHQFEKTRGGFYLTNGQMKGAMLCAGFLPKDEQETNWTFNLSRKLNQWSIGG